MEDLNKADEAGKSGEGTGSTAKEGAEGAKTEEKKGEGSAEGAGAQPAKKEPEQQKKEGDEPPLRKTKLEYILERKEKQLEKVRKTSKVEKEEEGMEISSDDEKLVEKVLNKKYGKSFAKMEAMGTAEEERANEAEIQGFLAKDPLGKYCKDIEEKIRTWSQHPSRASVPIKTIALEILGDKLIGIGAEMEREAVKKAAETKAGGGSARSTGGGKVDYSSMSDADFEKEIAKAKAQ